MSTACVDPPPASPRTSDAPIDLSWGFIHCDETYPGPTCALAPGRAVHLWMGSTTGRLRPPNVTHGSATKEADVDGGQRWRIVLEDNEGHVELIATRKAHAVSRTLRLIRQPPPPEPFSSAEYSAWLKRPDEKIRARFDDLPEPNRSIAYMFLAIYGFGARDPDAMHPRQLAWLKTAESSLDTSGSLATKARVQVLQADVLRRMGRFDEARRHLAPLLDETHPVQNGQLLAWNTLAPVLRRFGALRESLRYQERAARWANRLGEKKQWLSASANALDALERLGGGRRAETILKSLIDDIHKNGITPTDCARRFAIASVFWWGLARAHHRVARTPLSDVFQQVGIDGPWVAQQLESNLAQCRWFRSDAALNLALAALWDQRTKQAQRWLGLARKWGIDPWHEPWALDIEARLALAADHPETAQHLFEAMNQKSAGAPEIAWAAAIGLGLVAHAVNSSTTARHHFRAAEHILDRWPGAAELERGFASLLSRKLEAPRHLVSLRLADGQVKDALNVARRARARALRASRDPDRIDGLSPAKRQAWEQSLARYVRARTEAEALVPPKSQAERSAHARESERLKQAAETALFQARATLGASSTPTDLPPLPPSEMTLMLHPGIDRWLVMSQTSTRAWWAPLGPLDADLKELQTGLQSALETHRTDVEAATAIRVMAVGLATALDVHALPFDGRPLSMSKPVRYALDVARRQPANPRPEALVVANPEVNLAGAEKEAKLVLSRLDTQGWQTHRTDGQTTPTDLRRRLLNVDLFHFAGHASLGTALNPGLQLGQGFRFTLSDVLSLPRAPRWVVLSGCETGAGPDQEVGASIGLAHGFVLAGSEAVLATSRPVSDALALALAKHLYSQKLEGHEAWHRALQTLWETQPQSDWSAYRIFLP